MGQSGSAFPFRLGALIDQSGAPGLRLFDMHQGTHPVSYYCTLVLTVFFSVSFD